MWNCTSPFTICLGGDSIKDQSRKGKHPCKCNEDQTHLAPIMGWLLSSYKLQVKILLLIKKYCSLEDFWIFHCVIISRSKQANFPLHGSLCIDWLQSIRPSVLAFLWLLAITCGISWFFLIEIEQWFKISGKEERSKEVLQFKNVKLQFSLAKLTNHII